MEICIIKKKIKYAPFFIDENKIYNQKKSFFKVNKIKKKLFVCKEFIVLLFFIYK